MRELYGNKSFRCPSARSFDGSDLRRAGPKETGLMLKQAPGGYAGYLVVLRRVLPGFKRRFVVRSVS